MHKMSDKKEDFTAPEYNGHARMLREDAPRDWKGTRLVTNTPRDAETTPETAHSTHTTLPGRIKVTQTHPQAEGTPHRSFNRGFLDKALLYRCGQVVHVHGVVSKIQIGSGVHGNGRGQQRSGDICEGDEGDHNPWPPTETRRNNSSHLWVWYTIAMPPLSLITEMFSAPKRCLRMFWRM
jgi:hypothetical protein